MAQLAVVYRVSVRPLGDVDAPWQPLGDIDNSGTRLIDVLPSAFSDTTYRANVDGHENPQPIVDFARPLAMSNDHQIGAVFRHHEYGSRGRLHRRRQRDSIDFIEVDNQEVEIAVVASAVPQQAFGFLVFQMANGRSIKTGLERELRRWLRQHHRLYLHIEPTAPIEAVETAIRDHGIGPVTFRKLYQPAGLFDNEGDWWDDGDALAVAEYSLKPAKRRRLDGGKILHFLRTRAGTLGADEEPLDFPELAAFDDNIYDELSVEIMLYGRKKTLYIRPEGTAMTHAFSWELDITPGSTDDERASALAELLPES